MAITLKQIDSSNWMDAINLELTEKQEEFIAENWYSLLEANYEKNNYPFGIYKDDTMIGFCMYCLDHDYDVGRWVICRLMIDKNHQRKGYGSEALKLLFAKMKDAHGVSDIYISTDPNNKNAIKMYEKNGFAKTGEIVYDEAVFKISV
jgi:Acetyltransferases, including N-acetylases of ribosomal proteins